MTLLIAHNFSVCRDQIGTDNCLNYIKFDDGCNPDSRHYPYVIANCRMSCGECELSAGLMENWMQLCGFKSRQCIFVHFWSIKSYQNGFNYDVIIIHLRAKIVRCGGGSKPEILQDIIYRYQLTVLIFPQKS